MLLYKENTRWYYFSKPHPWQLAGRGHWGDWYTRRGLKKDVLKVNFEISVAVYLPETVAWYNKEIMKGELRIK